MQSQPLSHFIGAVTSQGEINSARVWLDLVDSGWIYWLKKWQDLVQLDLVWLIGFSVVECSMSTVRGLFSSGIGADVAAFVEFLNGDGQSFGYSFNYYKKKQWNTLAETAKSPAILQDLAPYYAPQEEVLSESSESLLSGSPAFATGSVSSGLASGSSAGFLFASLSFSCSVGNNYEIYEQ
ncbi:hypothetical protein TIFTF001_031741 [Ficus carica]|uniref:Uncharacterized protein n=1 Tax=Ficus carica TaxID=3494 RepID=A0AA88J5V6_FICCA|nr:hypothetical protein TIFTF001_031741 [Ficus carica]